MLYTNNEHMNGVLLGTVKSSKIVKNYEIALKLSYISGLVNHTKKYFLKKALLLNEGPNFY